MTGHTLETYLYDAWGTLTAYAPGTKCATCAAAYQWYALAGLYDCRARFYHPGHGRWLQPDPIGQAGGRNVYAYCHNDPVNGSDPSGLGGLSDLLKALDKAGKKVSHFLDEGLNPQRYEVDEQGPGGMHPDRVIITAREFKLGGPFWMTLAPYQQTNLWSKPLHSGNWREQAGEIVNAAMTVAALVGHSSEGVPKGGVEDVPITSGGDPAKQGFEPDVVAARVKAAKGAKLYKIGEMGKSFTGKAQFWSLENPLETPNCASKYGMPPGNFEGADFLETAVLKSDASFVTRFAPGVDVNLGGAIEVVTEEGGAVIQSFTTNNGGGWD